MFKTVSMPPVCIWGTLLDSKLTIVRNKIQANVNQGSHVIAKSLYDTKEKLVNCTKKQTKTEAAQASTTEEVKEETTNFNEVESENENTSNVEPEVNIQENNVFVGPDFTPFQSERVEDVSYGPDFSQCQNGVIYDVDPTIPMPEAIVPEEEEQTATEQEPQEEKLFEVTPEDIDHILKNMQGGAK